MNAEEAEEYTQALGQIHAGGWRLTLHAVRQGIPDALGLTIPEWQQRLGGYVRLSLPERREAVAELTEQEMTSREIADVLGVDQKTVINDRHAEENSSDSQLDYAEYDEPPEENSSKPEPELSPEAQAAREERERQQALEESIRANNRIFGQIIPQLYGTIADPKTFLATYNPADNPNVKSAGELFQPAGLHKIADQLHTLAALMEGK